MIRKILIKLGLIKSQDQIAEEYELVNNLKRITKMRVKPNKSFSDEEIRKAKKDAFKPTNFKKW